MGMFNVLDMSAAGLDVLQKRLEVVANNLANARTTGTDGAEYRPMTVVVHSEASSAVRAGDASLPRPVVTGVVELNSAPTKVYDPGHPDADEQGFISLPGVDPVSSMLDLVSIQRNYEANVRAFDITRSLLQRLLSLGGRQ